MEQETLIYIEEKDKSKASRLAKGFTLEDTLKRVYINALASELAMKYLAQEEISVSNVYNLHNIYKIREEFDIADIMLPNIHLDVRMVYDENFIFIPKSHFEYDLTPDIYLVFKVLEDESCVKFLGFFEPKLINKNNHNDKYYFIEKEKLSHPSDLKSYIENFNNNTTEAISQEELENWENLAIQLIDHDINDNDKRNLLKMLLKSSTLREDLVEFDNFEWISYHVATNEDFSVLSEYADFGAVPPAQDEFDLFEKTDEFETVGNLSDENSSFEQDELKDNSEINLPDTNFDEPLSNDANENLYNNESDLHNSTESIIEESPAEDTVANISDDLTLDNADEFFATNEELAHENDIQELPLNDEPADIKSKTIHNDLFEEPFDISEQAIDDTLQTSEEKFDLSDLKADKTELDFSDNLPDLSDSTDTNSTVEKIHLREFDELPFDTAENAISGDENVRDFDDINNLSEDFGNYEKTVTSDTDTEVTNFENLGERDDMKLQEELPFKDDEITPLEDISPVLIDETNNNDENVEQTKTLFEDLEPPQDNNYEPVKEEESIQTTTIEELDGLYANNAESYEHTDEELDFERPVTLDELSAVISEEQPSSTDEFLESLGDKSDETSNKSDNKVVSYENSTVITNQVDATGEFNIDINQPINTEDNDELEKLKVLYQNDGTLQDETSEFQYKTTTPEKGKKAIAIATIIVAALASLLIYSSFSKTDKQKAEQNPTSILEKNLPKLDEQELPQDNMILPEVKPKLEDTADAAIKSANKPKAPIIETPYLDVKKLSWSVPDYVSYNDTFRKYLQTAGKSLKLSLSSDLLLATEYAYSKQIQVNIVLSKEGTIENAKILQSSGSTQIDDIVLRTVNDTLKVLKAPAGVIVGDNIQLALKIYL